MDTRPPLPVVDKERQPSPLGVAVYGLPTRAGQRTTVPSPERRWASLAAAVGATLTTGVAPTVSGTGLQPGLPGEHLGRTRGVMVARTPPKEPWC